MYHWSLKGMNVGNGGAFSESGEKEALCFLAEYVFPCDSFREERQSIPDPVIFDVGANVGGYTLDVLSVIKNLKIYCFEPSHGTYEQLKKNVDNENVALNNFGISDKISSAVLYCNERCSGLASLYQRQLDESQTSLFSQENIMIDTIDNYCTKEKIPFIDFLKLDIEENDLNVLKGAKDILKSQRIAAIQIEFGG